MFHLGNVDILLLSNNDFYYYLSEICNYLFCILILVLSIHFKLIKKEYFVFWALYFLSPFFFNFVLFQPGYMVDQFHYVKILNQLKEDGLSSINLIFSNLEGLKQSRILVSNIFFFFIPMFSLLSITSVAFINKLLIFFTFIFLSKRIEVNKLILFFIIPSLILYSSVSLRDTLVLVLAVFSLFFIIERKVFLSLLFAILVLLIKLQNGPGLIFTWIAVFLLAAQKSYLRLFILGSISVGSVLYLFDLIGPVINLYRMAWAVEDGLSFEQAASLEIKSAYQFVTTIISDLPRFMLKPLPWQISSPLQLLVFLETVFLSYIFYVIAISKKFFLEKENLILIMGLIICMAINAITVSNFGTLARYRFIGFFPFLIAIYYLRQIKDINRYATSS